jgi:hypothetical protein
VAGQGEAAYEKAASPYALWGAANDAQSNMSPVEYVSSSTGVRHRFSVATMGNKDTDNKDTDNPSFSNPSFSWALDLIFAMTASANSDANVTTRVWL